MTLLDLLCLTDWDGWYCGGHYQAYVWRNDKATRMLFDGWYQINHRAAGGVSPKVVS